MLLLNWINRKRQARGFGVHSPFAFQLITDVIYGKHGYYAFLDNEQILMENGIELIDFKLQRLSHRLVRRFKPAKVLEIGSNNNINTLYIASALENGKCHCMTNDTRDSSLARCLHESYGNNIEFVNHTETDSKYDAIFIDLQEDIPVGTPEKLFSISSDHCFWVVSGINSRAGKQFWRNLVIMEKARITFDMKDIGIVILDRQFKKRHYLI